MAQVVPASRLPLANPRSLSAQLDLAIARETLRRTGGHDRLPALMARKAFKDATKLLQQVAEQCR